MRSGKDVSSKHMTKITLSPEHVKNSHKAICKCIQYIIHNWGKYKKNLIKEEK